jgi:hypothetical protein
MSGEYIVNTKPSEIFDLTDPTELESVRLYIQYLQVLQAGRVKPDRGGTHSVVWDSLDNIPDIEAVKKKISFLLNLNQDLIEDSKREIESLKRSR